MPNWCFNTLEVVGRPREVDAFRKLFEAKDREGNMHPLTNIYPSPACLRTPVTGDEAEKAFEMLAEMNGHDWYDWNVLHWGTNLDIDLQDVSENHDSDAKTMVVTYQFDSAWSPPTNWLDFASVKFPLLEFYLEYNEEGSGLSGEVRLKAGEEIEGG